jgi:hypothetical protein
MVNIKLSVGAFEDWLRNEMGHEFVEKDLARKHEKMAQSPFVFLRGTYWRWAETILEVCPDLAKAPVALAIGDIHLENFGTWRDIDGRLVWGVNDFDEAAEMPYALDLVRLATSALLAGTRRELSASEICAAILDGYRHGLRAPKAIVLDRDWAWLRKRVVVSNKERAKFWDKIDKAKYTPARRDCIDALAAAMPQPHLPMRTARRVAGTGSLGRPRWIGVAEWQGAPVVREVKALLPSTWPNGRPLPGQVSRTEEIARGRFRANDPWYRQNGKLLVRRLSPNNRKLEAETVDANLLTPNMLSAMGLELANVHLGTSNPREAIMRDLESRKADWLRVNAKLAAAAVVRDYKEWKAP